MEVYHPIRDEWRQVERYSRESQRELGQADASIEMFMAQRKFFSMSQAGIHVYDMHARSWTHLNSFSFLRVGPINYRAIPSAILAMPDDELLALVHFYDRHTGHILTDLIRCRGGLGRENEEIVWQKAEIPPSIASQWPRYYEIGVIIPIQL